MAQRWALLCGGDYYAKGTARQSTGLPPWGPSNLKGCVADVRLMTDFLAQFDIPKENIRILTATVDADGDGPVEPSDRWPTRTNIRRELQRIEHEAKSISEDQDRLLYFHYSGHGTLRRMTPDFNSNDIDDDFNGTALVMTDVALGGSYLTGRELGLLIKSMVENSGFRATVVLDSCFSGDGLRFGDVDHSFTARCLDEFDDSITTADKQAETELNDQEDGGGLRDASSIRPCWLSDPEKCAVITACSRLQKAGEEMFDQHKHGILTYWLVRILSRLRRGASQSPWPSHARTVDYVGREIIRKQRPMIYGEGLFEFFGLESYAEGESINTIRDGHCINIDIGSAQGVAAGSIYTIITDGDVSEDEHSARIRVTSVDLFRSRAEVLDRNALHIWPPQEVRRATLHQWALPRTVYIHCPGKFSDWHLLAAELTEKPGLVLRNGEPSETDLVVNLDSDHTFRISQEGNLLRRVSMISINQSTWPNRLAQVLSHVARFQTLKEFYTSSDNKRLLRGNFELKAPDEVEDGEVITLTMHYKGPLPLIWVSAYCFSPSWGISKLFPSSGTAARHLDVESGEAKADVDIVMSVPPKCRQDDPDQIEDHFFVLVSTHTPDGQVPSWGDICLPSILPTGGIEQMEYAQSIDQSDPRDDERDPRVKTKTMSTKQNTEPRMEWAVFHHTIHTTRT